MLNILKQHLLNAGFVKTFYLLMGTFFSQTSIVHNAWAGSVNGNASVEIRQAIAVSQTNALSFGVVGSTQANTITISPDGEVSSANQANLVIPGTSSGVFSANGSSESTVIISFSSGTLSGTGLPMALDALQHNGGQTPKFNTNGELIFAVGGSLHINANQTPGSYNGTYEVSVNYQ